MSPRQVKFRRSARSDIENAFGYYVQHDAREAATRLLEEIDRATRYLETRAHSYPVVLALETGTLVRRIRLWKFPFMLVYTITPNQVVHVFAVPHVRQDRYWLERVR